MSLSPELGSPRSFQSSAGPITWRERGRGRAIVFVHGLLVNGDLWRKVVPGLADDFRCITPDWPLGAHRPALAADADLSIEGVARLIAEFLEANELHDVVLVANDTGGAVSQVLMTRWPERIGAVVLTPCDCFDNFLPRLFRPLQWAAHAPPLLTAALQLLRIRRARRLPVALGWLAKRPVEPREIEDGYAAPFLSDAGVRRDTCKVLRAISPRVTQEAADRLPKLEPPVLLAWASEDRFFPPEHARRLAALLPDARIEWIDDSYTFVSEDQPERLVGAIRAFAKSPSFC